MNKISSVAGFVFLIVAIFCTQYCSAEKKNEVNHNFYNMGLEPKKITFTGNTYAVTTDGFTYTCSGNVQFGAISYVQNILLRDAGYVVIAQPIETLDSLHITYTGTITNSRVKVYTCDDNASWGEPIEALFPMAGTMTVKFPTKAGAYIKIEAPSRVPSTNANISAIIYHYQPCNCFPYTPE